MRIFLFTGLLCAVACVPARSFAADGVTLNFVDLGRGAYSLEGHIAVQATVDDAWRVLSDYEHIPDFVTSLRTSTITARTTDYILLEQVALGRMFFVSKKFELLLRVSEKPSTRIDFEDISGKDFSFYKGSWTVRPGTPDLDVVYHLDCKRKFSAPNFMARKALRESVESLLAQVRQEILRRKIEKGERPSHEKPHS